MLICQDDIYDFIWQNITPNCLHLAFAAQASKRFPQKRSQAPARLAHSTLL